MQYIFIHGLGQNAASWNDTVSHITECGQVLCPDLLTILEGKEVTYKNMYQAFSDYCNNITGPLNLCGLSLGAVLVLNYAADHPEKVQSVVLIGGQYKMPKTLLKMQNVIFRLMPESSFVKMGFQKKDFIDLTNSMMDLDFSNNLKDITNTSLVICGSKDTANKKAAQYLAENMPNAEICILENAGHEVNTEAPEALEAILNNFFQKQL